jgi:hypothetical protein
MKGYGGSKGAKKRCYHGKTGKAPGDGVPGGGIPATLKSGGGVTAKKNAVKRAYADTPIRRRK